MAFSLGSRVLVDYPGCPEWQGAVVRREMRDDDTPVILWIRDAQGYAYEFRLINSVWRTSAGFRRASLREIGIPAHV